MELSMRLTAALALTTLLATEGPAAKKGEVVLRAIDQKTGKPVAVRMHLKDRRGRPVRPPRLPYWHDHFVFDGEIKLELKPGRYSFELERGPEYKLRTGDFTINKESADTHDLEMHRFVDMKKEGWWSGETHVHRPLKDVELLMRAEDLHIGPVISWWNDKNLWRGKPHPAEALKRFDGNRFMHVMAGEDERNGGALLYFNLQKPLNLPARRRNFNEHPSPVVFLEQARAIAGAHIDIEKPFWWDVPVWIATGMVDSIGLANNHMCRDSVLANEAWGKPRKKVFYPNPHGNGRWTQDIYYHLLNCGLRIPPSAGSASGVLPNPVGYNRVYVHCEGELTWKKWWQGLRAGRVVVTNGPLLRPRVNGQLPGHVFTAQRGSTVRLNAQLQLSLRDKVEYLEVVKNGKVVHEVRLDEYAQSRGRLPELEFKESGWMLIRAVTSNTKTFRFGSTGPYYVEIGGKKRVSRKSARFFRDWVEERMGRIKIKDDGQRREVLIPHRKAQEFWQGILELANAD